MLTTEADRIIAYLEKDGYNAFRESEDDNFVWVRDPVWGYTEGRPYGRVSYRAVKIHTIGDARRFVAARS